MSTLLNGIDISNHQEGLEIEDVDFDFCICKATDGTRFVDKTFYGFATRVLAMGKLFGFYHFANNPKRGGTAIEQANYFVSATRKYFGQGIPVLDWEDSDWKYGGEVLSLGPSFALEWLREVYRLTGVKPWVYTSKSVCNEYDWSGVVSEGYALWGAQYATEDTLSGYQSNPWQDSNPWGAWGYSIPIFQYGSGYPSGSPVPLDLDLFYGDSSAWQMYVNGDGAQVDENADGESISSVSAQDVLNVARSYLGYNESDGSYKEIIDLYNTINPLPAGYELQYSDEWCDGFVSACAWKAGAYDLIGAECGVKRHIDIFEEKGIWNEDGFIVPNAGDIIVFNWNDDTQPNDGNPSHIGFVEEVSNGQIVCIEGNKSEAVSRRYIEVGWGYIRGFAQPLYGQSTSYPSGSQSGVTSDESASGGMLDVDGYCGYQTTSAMQRIMGTTVDGVISGQPVANHDYVWAVVSIEHGYGGSQLVRALQNLIGAETDGYWGRETSAKLQAYLFRKGYQVEVDGYFGTKSVMALQRCINDGNFGD